MPDLISLLEQPAAPRRRNIVAGWRETLDDANRDAFDELVRRARSGEMTVISLYRGLAAQGLDASSAAFRNYVNGES